ncbi:MAG: hypothetical protein WCD46_13890 [Desulfobacterales bacterium]|jgi:hypothetical protein
MAARIVHRFSVSKGGHDAIAVEHFRKKKTGDDVRKSRIESIKRVDGKLIIKGAEEGREDARDGFGWTIASMEDSGQMALSASGDLAAVAGSGACTPY